MVESEVANAGQGVVEKSERSKRKESTDVPALYVPCYNDLTSSEDPSCANRTSPVEHVIVLDSDEEVKACTLWWEVRPKKEWESMRELSKLRENKVEEAGFAIDCLEKRDFLFAVNSLSLFEAWVDSELGRMLQVKGELSEVEEVVNLEYLEESKRIVESDRWVVGAELGGLVKLDEGCAVSEVEEGGETESWEETTGAEASRGVQFLVRKRQSQHVAEPNTVA